MEALEALGERAGSTVAAGGPGAVDASARPSLARSEHAEAKKRLAAQAIATRRTARALPVAAWSSTRAKALR